MRSRCLFSTLLFLFCVPSALAQTDGFATPEALADTVLARFKSGSADAFAAVYPFASGQELVQFALDGGHERVPGLARVVRRTGDTAVLALSGYVRFGNTGDETAVARRFSGLYMARRGEGGRWRLAEQVPLADETRLTAHRLDVDLHPGEGLDVTDTMDVAVQGGDGLAVRLNHHADVESAAVAGTPVDYAFGGGLLWVDAKDATQLVLRYHLDVARDSTAGANSGRFESRAGHVRNQYFWHPFLWFDDAADFAITVRAPSGTGVATDLPQQETDDGTTHTVRAHSTEPTAALSLFYDRDWQPVRRHSGAFDFVVFGTPDFTPSPDTLAAAFDRAVSLLSARFGPPGSGYLAVVQQRARQGAGWPYMSNRAIAAAANGGSPMIASPRPRAFFGHEVAHGWTHPSGPARNFLAEGWATFAEGILLRDAYGPDAEDAFWESERNQYFMHDFEGRASLATDAGNGGVSYYKGSWVLRMLEEKLGREAFDRGIRAYAAVPKGKGSGYEGFVRALSDAAGHDVRPFLDPWYEGTVVPDLRAHVVGNTLIVEQVQEGTVFTLSVDAAVVSGSDTVRVSVPLRGREAHVALPTEAADGARVILDPDHHLLIHRTLGERVRLTTEGPAGAKVQLSGDFSGTPVAAHREGDEWVVELPLSAGRYYYRWHIGDDTSPATVIHVAARDALQAPYPR